VIAKSAGTWTPTLATNLISDVRTAADTSFNLFIPLQLPGSEVQLQGAKIKSVDVWYKVATSALDSFDDVVVTQQTLSATGVAVAGAAIASSCDAAHDSDAERKATGDHKMTVTITTPIFIEKNTAYILRLGANAGASTVFTLFGAQVNYTLRI